MKKNILILFVFLTIGFLVSCGGNKRNEFLGEVPSIAKHYDNKIEAKEKAMEDCTDMAEAFKLEKEKKKLKKERSAKIKEYVAANPFKPLPFEVLPGTAFTVKEAAITEYGSLRLSLTIDKDIKNKNGGLESRLSIYFKALDSNGNEIQNTKNAAAKFGGKALKAGSEFDLSSPWPMRYMEDFAKLVQITKEEYNGQ